MTERGMSELLPVKSREERIADYRKRQPIEELRRKQRKAFQRGFWTQEDLDLADAEARVLAEFFRNCDAKSEATP